VWAATALFGGLLVFWSLLTPISQAPDEINHADLVFHLAEGGSYPEHDGRMVGAAALGIRIYNHLLGGGDTLTLESAERRSERPTFDELGGDAPSEWVMRNQMPQHPPLYYHAAALVVRVERAVAPGPDWSFEREWLLVRLFSAALVLPLPLLTWLAARRLGASNAVSSAAALFPLAIPQVAHVGASINNDTLSVLLAAMLAVLLAGVLRGHSTRPTAVVAGFVCGVALLTKAYGVVLVIWVVVAYLAVAWRRPLRRREMTTSAVIAVATAALVGGWWWIVKLVRYGTPNPSVQNFPDRPGFAPDVGWWTGRVVVWLPERFWGTFDYLTVPMSRWVVLVASVVAVVAVMAAFIPRRVRWLRGPDPPLSRVRLAAYGSIVLVVLVFILPPAWSVYARSGWAQGLQGRYLFVGLAPLAILVAIGLVRLVGRWAGALVLGWSIVMVLDGWRVALRAWWGAPGASVMESLRTLDAWNPVADQTIWAALGLIAVCLAALVAALAHDTPQGTPWRRTRGEPPMPDPAVPSPTRAADVTRGAVSAT
jgi:4-amino-4-deoxy-L-arabinose transferase-like glycosyltransferase